VSSECDREAPYGEAMARNGVEASQENKKCDGRIQYTGERQEMNTNVLLENINEKDRMENQA
jgi:hypothetical protein